MESNDFTSVIPTAITVSYPRIFTDIPYATEIWTYLKKKTLVKPYIPNDVLSVELEARYKLIDKLLEDTGIHQVLELASGYSQRGLIFAKEYSYKYIELDLNKVVNLKKEIINNISAMPDSLKIVSGDATSKDDFDKCKEFFTSKEKVVVINEGLLRYLDFDEKKQVAQNVYMLLKEFSGKWITSDFTPKKFIQNQDVNIPNLNKNLSQTTDRNNASWRFGDEKHVRNFLNDIGFNNIEFHPFSEVQEQLSSPKNLNIAQDTTNKLLDGASVAVISID